MSDSLPTIADFLRQTRDQCHTAGVAMLKKGREIIRQRDEQSHKEQAELHERTKDFDLEWGKCAPPAPQRLKPPPPQQQQPPPSNKSAAASTVAAAADETPIAVPANTVGGIARDRNLTCFAGASLIVLLLSSPKLKHALKVMKPQQVEKSSTTAAKAEANILAILKLFLSLLEAGTGVTSARVLQLLRLPCLKKFNDARQHDAHEFLQMLLENVPSLCQQPVTDLQERGATGQRRERNDHNNNKNDDENASVLLQGQSDQITRCVKAACKHVSDPEHIPWHILLVPIPTEDDETRSVQSLVDQLAKATDIEEGMCDKCRKPKVQVSTTLVHLPAVLLVGLQRFKWITNQDEGDGGEEADAAKDENDDDGATKLLTAVEVSETLILNVSGGVEHKYALRGVVVHLGNDLNSGHYVSYIRGFNDTTDDGDCQWFEFDDACVSPADEHARASWQCEAYLLCYEKVQVVTTTSSATKPTGGKKKEKKKQAE